MKQDERGVVEVLKHARLLTEQQLQNAYKAQGRSGDSLKDLLFKELSWESIKHFLNYELPSPFSSEKRALGAALKEAGWISPEQLDEAEREAGRTGHEVGQKLVDQKVITETQLATALAQQKQTGLPLWRTLINLGLVNTQQMSQVLGIGNAIAKMPAAQPAGPLEDRATVGAPASPSDLKKDEAIRGMSAVQLVDAIIESGSRAQATDIHLDPQCDHLRVRYRIDGILYDIMELPTAVVPEVISRLKVLGNMDITQRRHAQEGHFVQRVGQIELDLRLATAPTVLGEKIAIRLLSEKNVLTGIAQLGMEPHQIELLEVLMTRPHGTILTTGPVGAGKTTTLYALLNEVNIFSKNVMTIEDPVEYELRGVNQMQVDNASGFGFVEGLRAILRQDPNIIMVGEIRDEETARTAVKAAMTGVLVLSTLHTNSAPGAVTALSGLNVPRFLISSALVGVVAQRLVRKVCERCKTSYQPAKDVLKQLGVPAQERERLFYKGTGCEHCFQTGYFGRTGVYEVLSVTEELREAIFRGDSYADLVQIATKSGMQSLAQSALNRVLDGTTTAEEFLRVIFT
jgi:type II secretory ATPase GspE/PulE/Tfp pilus assembly ATPase PilB-like protein